ncbi:MAG: hypothetical protein HYZ53_20220 [Planctomycetes bacterium]|nr:hypothetical protein [Planctomycetota bacterium]
MSVAASDVDYREAADRSPLELRLLDQAFGGRQGIHQGHYILSPGGRLLASASAMWHVTGPGMVLEALDKGLAAYRALPRGERLLRTVLDPGNDRADLPREEFSRPEGCLDLRVVSRCLPFAEMDRAADTRHPDFYRLDRLWYTPEEYAAFVPREGREGASFPVTGAALDRLVRLHMGTQVQPTPAWDGADVRSAELVGEVTGVKGGQLTVHYRGHVSLAGTRPQNRRSYRGDLLGDAVYEPATRRFRCFELLALGTHTLPADDTHGNAGSRTAPLGVLITLNPDGAQDKLPPTFWRWGYPRGWPRR